MNCLWGRLGDSRIGWLCHLHSGISGNSTGRVNGDITLGISWENSWELCIQPVYICLYIYILNIYILNILYIYYYNLIYIIIYIYIRIATYYIALHCTALHYITLFCLHVFHCLFPKYRYTTLLYIDIKLHYTALHYTSLHCIKLYNPLYINYITTYHTYYVFYGPLPLSRCFYPLRTIYT